MKQLSAAALVVIAGTLAAPAQAATPQPVVRNVLETVGEVLKQPVGSVGNIVQALPQIGPAGVATVTNLVALVPALLTKNNVPTQSSKISIPLPGPGILDAKLVDINQTLKVQLASGGGSLDVKVVVAPK